MKRWTILVIIVLTLGGCSIQTKVIELPEIVFEAGELQLDTPIYEFLSQADVAYTVTVFDENNRSVEIDELKIDRPYKAVYIVESMEDKEYHLSFSIQDTVYPIVALTSKIKYYPDSGVVIGIKIFDETETTLEIAGVDPELPESYLGTIIATDEAGNIGRLATINIKVISGPYEGTDNSYPVTFKEFPNEPKPTPFSLK